MSLKYYTQYVSKFRKLNSGHKPGICQFSFQSQRRFDHWSGNYNPASHNMQEKNKKKNGLELWIWALKP